MKRFSWKNSRKKQLLSFFYYFSFCFSFFFSVISPSFSPLFSLLSFVSVYPYPSLIQLCVLPILHLPLYLLLPTISLNACHWDSIPATICQLCNSLHPIHTLDNSLLSIHVLSPFKSLS